MDNASAGYGVPQKYRGVQASVQKAKYRSHLVFLAFPQVMLHRLPLSCNNLHQIVETHCSYYLQLVCLRQEAVSQVLSCQHNTPGGAASGFHAIKFASQGSADQTHCTLQIFMWAAAESE